MSSRQKLIYASGDAYSYILENLTATTLSAVTSGFSLAILAFFTIVLVNLNSMVAGWGERTHIVAYITEEASEVDVALLTKSVGAMSGVKEALYVSSDDALKGLRKDLKEHKVILEGVEASIFPSSFEIKVTDEFMNPDKIVSTVEALKRLDWVAQVQYSNEHIEQFASFLAFFRFAALAIGVFLGAAVIFIISNTVRLTVYARKETVEIMRFIGASDIYIKVPFFIEGLLMGLAGGFIAVGFLYLGHYHFDMRVPEYLRFLIVNPFGIPALMGMLLGVGVALGTVGSFITLRKFLRV